MMEYFFVNEILAFFTAVKRAGRPLARNFSGADIQAAVNCPGIGRDDFAIDFFCQPQSQVGLAGRGGTDDCDYV